MLQAVSSYSKAACKCRGVSGSCSMRTCWNQLPTLRKVGGRLRQQYDSAHMVAFNAHGTSLYPVARRSKNDVEASDGGPRPCRPRVRRRRRPTRNDLVYIDPSPDYCLPDTSALVTGSTGTQGRPCQLNSASTEDSCDELCCGRGYNTQTWQVAVTVASTRAADQVPDLSVLAQHPHVQIASTTTSDQARRKTVESTQIPVADSATGRTYLHKLRLSVR